MKVPNSKALCKNKKDAESEKFKDFVAIIGKNNSMSAYEVDMDESIHPSRPRVIFYDNFDKED